MLILICDECGSPLQSDWEACHNCGLEVPWVNDLVFGHSVKSEARSAGERESRERDVRKSQSYGTARGFVCILCFELFKEIRPTEVLEGDSRILGFEQPGSDLAHFLLRQDFDDHVDSMHGGKKAYWKAVNDRKRMAAIRSINATLKKKEIVNSSRRDTTTDEPTTSGE